MGYANSTFLDVDAVYAIIKKDIKDINNEIEDLSKLTKWLGVTTTPITENSTVNPIVISGVEVTAVSGDIAKYGDDEFKFTDVGTWQYYYDKTDVYTKDETDALLADKIPNAGNTTSDDMTIKRDTFKLANNATDESYVATDENGNTFVVGQNRVWLDGKGANVDLREHILLRPAANKKAYYGNDNNGLTDDMEIAVKGYVDAADNEMEALLKDNAPKNLLPITLDGLKALNKEEYNYEWTDNVCYDSTGEITYTVNTDEAGRVESISVSGTADTISQFFLTAVPTLADETYEAGSYIASTAVSSMPEGVYLRLLISGTYINVADEETVTLDNASGIGFSIRVMQDVVLDGLVIKPMFRRAAVADGTFEVGYRTQKELDADLSEVEDRLDNLSTDYNDLTNKPSINNVTLTGNKTLSDLGISEHDNYTRTLLWQNTSGMTVVSPITLADGYINYDLIVFELAINAINNIQQFTIDTAALEINKTCCLSYQGKSMGIVPISNNSFTATTWDGGDTYVIQKIYGVNLGARKPYKETILWTNTSMSSGGNIQFTLSSAANLFDTIIYDLALTSGGTITNYMPVSIPVSLATTIPIVAEYGNSLWFSAFLNAQYTGGEFSVVGNWTLQKIVGISYGGSVKGRNVTSLYHGTSLANSIVLNDAYTNYDEITIVSSNTGEQVNSATYNTNDVSTNNLIGIWTNAGYIGYRVTSDTVLTLSGNVNIDHIADIYGIKYDSDYITIDSEMSATSENPVQNKVIKEYVDSAIAAITDYESEVFPNA